MAIDCAPAVSAPATPHFVPVRVITEAGWPVAFWDGNRRYTVLGLARSWQGTAPPGWETGWCVYYEIRVRNLRPLRLLLAIQSGSWYLELPAG